MLSEYSYFWLDAICINQADLEEKAVQIPLMKQIYSNADIVVIWLGPPTKNSTLALEFLGEAREKLRRKDLKEHHDLEWYLATPATTTDSPEWEAVAEVFCEPWFIRFWCIQEVLLAIKKLMAIDGNAMCSWSGLHFGRHVLARGVHRHLRVRGRLNEAAAPHLKGIRYLVHDYHYKRNNAFNSFTTVWHQSMSYQATNLVDYVYGVLGLITSEPGNSPAVKPDYGRNDVEVFAEAVSLCLRRDNNHDVLSLAGIGFTNESKSRTLLPSWIPNFAMKPAPRSWTFRSRYPNRAGLSPLEGVDSKPDFRFENGRLIVKGVIVDTIDEFIADTFVDKRTLDDNDNDLPAWTRRALAAAHESSLFDISTPKSWEKWARTMSSHNAAHVGAHVTLDRRNWMTQYVKLYESFLKVHANNPQVQGLDLIDARERINGDNAFSDDEKREAHHYYNAITVPLQWKRIAVTERRDLAVVQRLSKLGDKVCILPSSKVPLLIRQVPDTEDRDDHNHYQLVGESYVDGLMFGEGLSMGSLQDIVLV
jgi:hypothetical protein